MASADRLNQAKLKQANQALSRENRDVLIDRLIDQWSEESFPASDPPGRLPPSLFPPSQPGQRLSSR